MASTASLLAFKIRSGPLSCGRDRGGIFESGAVEKSQAGNLVGNSVNGSTVPTSGSPVKRAADGGRYVQQFEKHFHARMVAVENDARAAARFVYTDRTFNHQVAIDPDIYAAINRHAGFWRVIAASLQTSTFITLGRLYDDKGTRNIAELLEYSNEHIGIFSHATFIARKMTG